MLNAVRNLGLKYWRAAKIVGYKPILWQISPLQFLFSAKILIGYLLVPATNMLAARSRFEHHLPDCDMTTKDQYRKVLVFVFSLSDESSLS